MTIRTASRIGIASSPAAVWAYFSDVSRWPEWVPTVAECRILGATALQAGVRLEQRAKLPLGFTRRRRQDVTAVDAPRTAAFAGPMGTSAARWGMEFEPAGDGRTQATMWIEVDLAGVMRVVPARTLERRIQRVSNEEMAAMKLAVESTERRNAEP